MTIYSGFDINEIIYFLSQGPLLYNISILLISLLLYLVISMIVMYFFFLTILLINHIIFIYTNINQLLLSYLYALVYFNIGFSVCIELDIFKSAGDILKMVGDIPFTIPYPRDPDMVALWFNGLYIIIGVIVLILTHPIKYMHIWLIEVRMDNIVVRHAIDIMDRTGENLKELYKFDRYQVKGRYLHSVDHGHYYGITWVKNGEYPLVTPIRHWYNMINRVEYANFNRPYFEIEHIKSLFIAPNKIYWSFLMYNKAFIIGTASLLSPRLIFPSQIMHFMGDDMIELTNRAPWTRNLWTIEREDHEWNQI